MADEERNIEFLGWLTGWRNEAQLVLFDLLKLGTEKGESIRKDDDLRSMFQLLAGSAFSLWRAVFLSAKPLRSEKAFDDVTKFLDRVVSHNIINYSDEQASRRWTAGFYVSHIQYRMYHIHHSYREKLNVTELDKFIADWGPFSEEPVPGNRRKFYRATIDCLRKLTTRLSDLAAVKPSVKGKVMRRK